MDLTGVMDFVVRMGASSGEFLIRAFVVMFVISAVIFVHELGHFLVARWAGVLVERFSIGLGPILYSFRWGETEYALSWIPLGGYVKMLGQVDTPEVESRDDNPRSYQNKSVGWRMAIISAGVIMNVIFGFVCFVLAYQIGVPYSPSVIGAALPDRPAWKAGIRAGDQVVAINGTPRNDFSDIKRAVMLTNPRTESINFTIDRPGGGQFDAVIRPNKNSRDLHPLIGVLQSPGLVIRLFERPKGTSNPMLPESVKTGDRILAVDGEAVNTYRELVVKLYEKRTTAVTLTLQRDGDKPPDQRGEKVQVTLPANFVRTLGLRMQNGPIDGVQPNSPAAKAVDATTGAPQPILPNDLITAVDGVADFDPMRLPDLITAKAGTEVVLKLAREGKSVQTLEVKVRPEPVPTWSEFPEGLLPRDDRCFLSVPSIGIAYKVLNAVERVEPNSPAAAAGLLKDDTVIRAKYTIAAGDKQKPIPHEVDRDYDSNWPMIFWNLQEPNIARQIELTVVRKGQTEPINVSLETQVDKTWPFHLRGLELGEDLALRQESSLSGAIVLGVERTKTSVIQLYLVLRGLALRTVSYKNLSGPPIIAKVTYALTKEPLGLLLEFLAFLSINLAIINFLPIPILDGGHMAFLTYEALFRRPASERAMLIANWVGLCLLLGLMVLVISLDILRLSGFMT